MAQGCLGLPDRSSVSRHRCNRSQDGASRRKLLALNRGYHAYEISRREGVEELEAVPSNWLRVPSKTELLAEKAIDFWKAAKGRVLLPARPASSYVAGSVGRQSGQPTFFVFSLQH